MLTNRYGTAKDKQKSLHMLRMFLTSSWRGAVCASLFVLYGQTCYYFVRCCHVDEPEKENIGLGKCTV